MSRILDRAALFALALLVAAGLRADERYSHDINKTLNLEGSNRVTIDHSLGGVKVRTVMDSDVRLKARIRTSDADLGRQIRVITSEGPNGVTIRTEYPKITNRSGEFSFSVDLEVLVPEKA